MKSHNIALQSLIFLVLSLIFTGCLPFGPVNNEEPSAPSKPRLPENASINFKFVLPDPSRSTITPAILPVVGGQATVTINLVLLNPGNRTEPSITLKWVMPVNASGSAIATFSGLPVKPVIGQVKIASGSIMGYADFQGAIDLASGSNTLEISPIGSHLIQDVLANTLFSIIQSANTMEKAPTNLVSFVQTAINNLDLTSSNAYLDAVNKAIEKIGPASYVQFVVAQDFQSFQGKENDATVWTKTYSQVWDSADLYGTNPTEMRIKKILRPGVDGFGYVTWEHTSLSPFAISRHDSKTGNRQSFCLNPGSCDQAIILNDGKIVVGGYNQEKNCPVVFLWEGQASASTYFDISKPDAGLTWVRYFTEFTGTTTVAKPSIESLQFDGYSTIVTGVRDSTSNIVRFFRISLSDGKGGNSSPKMSPNQYPLVSLTSPASGSSVPAGTTVNMVATASDIDGSIAKVEFYLGQTKLGEDLGAPYSYSFAPTTVGSHSLTAKAVDNQGAITTSLPVGISVTSSVVGGSAKELIITEIGTVYYGNIPAWIEIYNNSDQAIDLSQYTLKAQSKPSGATSWSWSNQTYSLSLNLAAKSYGLLFANVGTEIYPSQRTQLVSQGGYIFWWQENGCIELIKDGVTIDFVRFGTNSTAPTTAESWTGGSASALPTVSPNEYGKSLSRQKDLKDSNSASDWVIRQFSTPGGPNDANSDTDADQDGIPDVCEAQNETFIGWPLFEWGAKPNQKDIFIHIDYMDSQDLGIIPRKESLEKVVSAFRSRGYEVHFDVGDLFGSGLANFNLDNKSHKVPFANGMTLGQSSGLTDAYKYKADYLDIAKRGIFHYCVYANSQLADGSRGSSTGLGEINGNDFILTMGKHDFSVQTEEDLNYLINDQASTLMHELGHNLGLEHGGNEEVNFKPNYRSVMNYLYGFGLPAIGNSREGDRYYHKMWSEAGFSPSSPFYQYFSTSGSRQLHNGPYTNTYIMDFSTGGGATLQESNLTESAGIGYSGSAGIDWNGDGDTNDVVSKDINIDGNLTTYSDFNDWGNINLVFSRNFSGAREGFGGKEPRKFHCFTVDDYQEISKPPCGVLLLK